MIKLQYNHICVWFISSAICFMHFSSFILYFCDAQRRSFHSQHPNTSFRHEDYRKIAKRYRRIGCGRAVWQTEQNTMHRTFCVGAGDEMWLALLVLYTDSFRRSTNWCHLFVRFSLEICSNEWNVPVVASSAQFFRFTNENCTSSRSDEFKLKCKML